MILSYIFAKVIGNLKAVESHPVAKSTLAEASQVEATSTNAMSRSQKAHAAFETQIEEVPGSWQGIKTIASVFLNNLLHRSILIDNLFEVLTFGSSAYQ